MKASIWLQAIPSRSRSGIQPRPTCGSSASTTPFGVAWRYRTIQSNRWCLEAEVLGWHQTPVSCFGMHRYRHGLGGGDTIQRQFVEALVEQRRSLGHGVRHHGIKAAGTQTPPVVVSEGIKTHEFEDDGKTVTDPHVWNSVPNVIIWVGNIEKALAAADPENAATFKANADRYRKELEALNSEIHTKIDAVPVEKRKVLTSHDAFGYYGKEYGVSFLAPLGISTEAEASAADVAELIEQIKKEGIKVYFIENSNDPRLVKQIADATGAAVDGVLYPEALSAADGPASTYIKMMQYNTGELAAAIAK